MAILEGWIQKLVLKTAVIVIYSIGINAIVNS